MKQVSELLETGVYETFNVEKTTTIRDLLKKLGLEGKYFGILINGKKAELNQTVRPSDEVVILPHIAGGELTKKQRKIQINQRGVEIEQERIKKEIILHFSDKKFTTGDIYYSMNSKFSRSEFGKFFNALRHFTKTGFLRYSMKVRGSPTIDAPTKRRGAVYTLNPPKYNQ